MRICAHPQCPVPVDKGYCPTHARELEQRRGSARQRGYTDAWERFRRGFFNKLIELGILPVCGASLPTGPNTQAYSQCAQEGRLTAENLELDHDPPLTHEERLRATQGDRRAFDNPNRVGFLCRACHARKTRSQQTSGVESSSPVPPDSTGEGGVCLA